MKRLLLVSLVLLGCLASVGAIAKVVKVTDPSLPRALPQTQPVSVQWNDPSEFGEMRYSGNRRESERGTWVKDLAQYMQDKATRYLQPGQQLDITITDITRAGSYLPTGASPNLDTVRVIKDIYPPRISLDFKLSDGNGQVISEGQRKLVDSAFLMGSNSMDTDTLRYEKRMIDDWLRREFGEPKR
ncbi:DUF3016 domain-containing protein [Pseudoxanthomonas dokdonensis]|uniref:Membrane protein n=1 Tax=Pseudoxanthomonas dokdonensis TaxID=344882 RepID=A0A0R0D0Y0_9GAMM|nr:DUF3016 domain-containing protein [Pseudoxanthomonas dokdonensis]KRG71668.1 membrane protein [Pseudoxanthomonas dokdonensis]